MARRTPTTSRALRYWNNAGRPMLMRRGRCAAPRHEGPAMPITIFENLVYGDTSGTLGRANQARDDSLIRNDPNSTTLIGDAHDLVANASGGDDTLVDTNLNSASILGDAFNLSDHARGGDDLIGV